MVLLSSVPTKASSPAVSAVWLRAPCERVTAQADNDVRHGEPVLSGAGHHPVLGTFRFPFSGHKTDGERREWPQILALGHGEALSESVVVLALRLKTILQCLWRRRAVSSLLGFYMKNSHGVVR